jgi:RNA polymerase sigma-70 factor (ECF subfamily)
VDISDQAPAIPAAVLDRAYREGAARWTGVDVPRQQLAAYLAARVGEKDPAALHGADLYLACACATGDPAALRAFDREYLATLGAMLTKLDPPASVVEDVEQALRARLFVRTPERAPAITRYAGTGSLAGWLKVVAIREALAIIDKDKHEGTPDELELLLAPGTDPELDHMREQYRHEFRAALSTAVEQLTERERGVLRCHLVERMSIDRIGEVYGVHRATAARWLATIRERLFERTRAALTARLAIGPSEYESIMRLIQSQLHVSLQLDD